MIQERIRVALQSLAGNVLGRSGDAGAEGELLREYGQLREENMRLKARVDELAGRLEVASVDNGGRGAGLPSGDVGDTMEVGRDGSRGKRLYRVREGDSLTRISLKMYGTRDETDAIFEANRDRLDDPNDLRPGQVLTIPAN